MNTIQIGDHTRHSPAEWNELSVELLLRIAPEVMSMYAYLHQVKIPALQKERKARTEITLLKHLLGKPWRFLINKLDAEQVAELRSLAEPFINKITLSDTIIKEFKHRGTVYHGPGDMMAQVSVDEYGYADTYFRKWLLTQNEVYLNSLIACLYRPKRKNYQPLSPTFKGDIREDFNRYTIEARARALKDISKAIKAALLLQFWGAREWMANAYPAVFTKKKRGSGRSFGWGGFLIELSGQQFGDVYQTRKAMVIDVMGFCQIQAVRAEEYKANARKK